MAHSTNEVDLEGAQDQEFKELLDELVARRALHIEHETFTELYLTELRVLDEEETNLMARLGARSLRVPIQVFLQKFTPYKEY